LSAVISLSMTQKRRSRAGLMSGMYSFADRFIRAGLRHYPGRYQRLDRSQRTDCFRDSPGLADLFRNLGTAHHPCDAAVEIFQEYVVHRANIALTLVAFAMFGCFFFMSQYLQTVHGYNPLQAGVRLLPMAVAAFIGAMVSARLAQQIGTKLTVGFGIFLAPPGCSISTSRTGRHELSENCHRYEPTALGMGVTMSPATNSIMVLYRSMKRESVRR